MSGCGGRLLFVFSRFLVDLDRRRKNSRQDFFFASFCLGQPAGVGVGVVVGVGFGFDASVVVVLLLLSYGTTPHLTTQHITTQHNTPPHTTPRHDTQGEPDGGRPLRPHGGDRQPARHGGPDGGRERHFSG